MLRTDDPDMSLALDIVRQARQLVLTNNDPADIRVKADGTIVTGADHAVQELAAQMIAERGGADDYLLGEESAVPRWPTGDDRERVWVLDPLDGSWLHAAGRPGCMISLALVRHGIPQLGMTLDPHADELTWAVRDGGVWSTRPGWPTPTVTESEIVSGGCVIVPGCWGGMVDTSRLITELIDYRSADVMSSGSSVADALDVAYGFAVAAVYPYTSPWDVAAAALCVTEAGGTVTDLYGDPIEADQPVRGALFSNGYVHDEMLAILAGCRP